MVIEIDIRFEDDVFKYRLGLSEKLGKSFQERYDVKNVKAYEDMYDDAVTFENTVSMNSTTVLPEASYLRSWLDLGARASI